MLRDQCLSSTLPERKKRTFLRKLDKLGLSGVDPSDLTAADDLASDEDSQQSDSEESVKEEESDSEE